MVKLIEDSPSFLSCIITGTSRTLYPFNTLSIIASIVLLIVTIFPDIMYVISNQVGIETPINSALVLAGVFVIIILITITSIVSQLNRTVRVLVQEVALLEKRIRDVSNEKEME